MNCKVCRAELSQADFDAGRAVTLLRRHYCLSCSNELAGTGGRRGLSPGVAVGLLVAVLAAALLVLGFWLAGPRS